MTTAAKPQPSTVEYQLFDVVVTRVDVPNVSGRTVPAGTAGAIVEIFDTPWRGYMVEFPDDEELDLPILRPEDLEPWTSDPASA